MRGITIAIEKGGIAAFFFFSYIVMLLWNSLIAGHLGLGPRLSYLQAAGLWFLITILSSFVGFASRPFSPCREWGSIGERIKERIKDRISEWVEPGEPDEIGERIERKIKRAFARWADADEDLDWSELGDRIEEKLRAKFREWIDTD